MKTAFFHDCVFVVDSNNIYYTKGALDAEKLSEYVKYFDQLTVFTRSRKITNDDNIKKMTKASTDNVTFDSIDNLNVFSLFFGKYRKKIRELVKNSDFIIARIPSYIGHVAIQEAKKMHKNYLVEMVACPWDALWNYGKITKKICALPTYILHRIDVYNAKNVIYVSEEFLQQRYPTKGKSIGCSDVVLNDFDENILDKRIKKMENKEESFKLCTLANVELKYKGQEYVIKALKKLKDKGIIIEYYLAGGGNPNRLKRLIKKLNLETQVHLLGGIPHDKIFELLDNIDLYVQPSLQEGLPRSLVEAMSRACPAIGSKTGGIPELISKEGIFSRKNVNDISKMILNLINSKELLKNLAKTNFEHSKEFKNDILISKRNKFYNEILGE